MTLSQRIRNLCLFVCPSVCLSLSLAKINWQINKFELLGLIYRLMESLANLYITPAIFQTYVHVYVYVCVIYVCDYSPLCIHYFTYAIIFLHQNVKSNYENIHIFNLKRGRHQLWEMKSWKHDIKLRTDWPCTCCKKNHGTILIKPFFRILPKKNDN